MALGSDALQIGMAAMTVPPDYRKRTEGGQSAPSAMLGAGLNGASTALLSIPTALVLPLLPMAVRGLLSVGNTQSQLTRQRATPFSHRLEASQMAAQMQGYALSRMGQMQGLGNEAPNYAGRYGRG